jgi:integrase
MPAKFDLTWDPKNRRWRKYYKGKRYVVSCQQLGGPETKEGSYQAANAWWAEKKAEIDLARDAAKPQARQYEEAIANRRDMIAWMHQEGRLEDFADLHDRLTGEINRLEADFSLDVPPTLETTHDGHLFRAIPIPFDDPKYGEWWERIQSIRDHRRWTRPPSIDGTIAARVNEYLARRRAEAEAGQIKTTTYMAVRDRLPHLKNYCGEMDASKIDERTLSGYHQHLLSRVGKEELSPQYAAHLLSAAKSFCRHIWRERVLEHLPRNLDALKIKVADREVPTFDLDELGTILDFASEKTCLYLMLMMNCGMYQSDVAALRPSQVDWTGGRITRKRTKTEAQQNAPKVSYLLWDETFRLLQKYGQQHGPLVLTNENGSALYRRPVNEDGSVGLTDNIKKAYERVCKKLKFKTTPLMYLRKTSATLLETHDSFGRYAQYFLGQAPQSLAEKRYARPSPDQFDRAVRWLGLQYGYATSR